MSNYLYFQHEEQLANRFNVDGLRAGYGINGLNYWREFISRLLNFLFERDQSNDARQYIRAQTYNELMKVSGNDNFNIYNDTNSIQDDRSTEELIVTVLLMLLQRLNHPLSQNRCPRLFISHRRDDKDYALRIAQLAAQNGFAYWVDVLDPDLQSLGTGTIPERLRPFVIACIIEMALINCTHVIACMTPNSRGTLWIPYEYGRIKDLPGLSINTCAWLDPNLLAVDFPEYLLLGEIAKNEMEIESWLSNEWSAWSKTSCRPDIADLSAFGNPNKLPEESNDEIERKKEKFEEWLSQGMPLLKDLEIKNVPLKFNKRKRPST